MPKPRILVIGSSNTDMTIRLERIPQPGETILGGDFSTASGGKGANQAVAAARAGGEVTFVARVGQDMFGEKAVAGFLKDRIHVEHIVRDADAPSGAALIFLAKDGQNSIAVAGGANARLSPGDVQKAESVFASAHRVLMQLEIPLETVQAAAECASRSGVQVMAPGFQIEAVDTTAAGDVFNGALAVALAEGKPLIEAVRFANAAAAISVIRLGAQLSAPDRAEIEALVARASHAEENGG